MEVTDKMAFLAESIARAKIVQDKVEDGRFNQLDRSQKDAMSEYRNDEVEYQEPAMLNEEQAMVKMSNSGHKLANSKIPDFIKKSLMETPIIDPTTPPGMNTLVQEASKKMGQTINESPRRQNIPAPQQPVQMIAPTLDTKLIEYIIEKTVKETLKQVNEQISVDENIQIRIGSKTFGGKLTVLKEQKK